MKRTKILYWVFTGIFSFMMLGSAIPDIIMDPMAVEGMHNQLGYPMYFIPFIGVAKVIGVVAVLLPVPARVKEWAYAGLFFDLIGATFSIIAAKQPFTSYFFMILPITFCVLSYIFFRKKTEASMSGTPTFQ